MNTTSIGQAAEGVAVDFLKKRGYSIVERNWRTRFCEIDVVARKINEIAFVEVKYRKVSSQGAGLDYITQRKLQRMRFAADLWVHNHEWEGDYSLAVVEVSGGDLKITAFVEDAY